jgi:hypothetical protein
LLLAKLRDISSVAGDKRKIKKKLFSFTAYAFSALPGSKKEAKGL